MDIQQCPICGNSAVPEFYEPRGYALCPRCGAILRRIRGRLEYLYNVDPAGIDLQTSFVNDLGLDSLDVVELVLAVEEEFGMEITDEEAEKIKTVEDVVRLLQTRRQR